MMKKLLIYSTVVLIAFSLFFPVMAGIFGRGFRGALGGAILGSLVGGRRGAQAGAVIGGGIGLIRGAQEKKRQEEARAAAFRRQQEERTRWAEKQKREEEERMRVTHEQKQADDTRATLVIEIQKALVRVGIDPGEINGELSPATVNAIKLYQMKNNLLETGQPSQELLKHMLRHGG
jgi:hypothetical protein